MGKDAPEDSVVLVVEFTPRAGCHATLVEALVRNVEVLVAAGVGCDSYAVHDGPDSTILMITSWASTVDATAHMTSTAAADQLEEFADLLGAVPLFRIVAPRTVDC